MKLPYPASLILLVAALAADRGAAQSPAASVAQDSPVASAAPAAPRATSPATAALLRTALPKLAPLSPPAPAATKSDEELPDLRETDRPRNAIIRLPPYLVQEKRPPVFRARDFVTNAGRASIGMKRYPGLGLLPLSFLNRGFAAATVREDERLEDMAAFADLVRTGGAFGDAATYQKLKQLWETSFIRDESWIANGGSWVAARR